MPLAAHRRRNEMTPSFDTLEQKQVLSTVDLTGDWQGTLTQIGVTEPPYYIFHFDLVQTNGQITGTSEIDLPSGQNPPVYYATIQLTGSLGTGLTGNATFTFSESTITQQNPIPGMPWLIKTGKLSVAADADSMMGVWQSGLQNGDINVTRVVSTPTPTPTTPTPTTPTPTSPTPTTPTPTSPTPTTPTPTTPTPTPAPSPPHALGIVAVGQSKKGVNSITIAFDEALNSGSAENPGSYSLLGAVTKHRKTVFSKKLGMGFVIYDSTANTVKVELAKPYKGQVQIGVHAGIVAANGATSAGEFTTVVR